MTNAEELIELIYKRSLDESELSDVQSLKTDLILMKRIFRKSTVLDRSAINRVINEIDRAVGSMDNIIMVLNK